MTSQPYSVGSRKTCFFSSQGTSASPRQCWLAGLVSEIPSTVTVSGAIQALFLTSFVMSVKFVRRLTDP